jgi:hypothetical protein
VLAAPAPGAQADEAVKGPCEGRLVTEAGLAGDIDERGVGRRQRRRVRTRMVVAVVAIAWGILLAMHSACRTGYGR